MTKRLRRLLCLGLCLLLCVSMFPIRTFAVYDDVAPILNNVTLSATKVNAPCDVEVIVDATDDLSDVDSGVVIFRSADGNTEIKASVSARYWNIDTQSFTDYEDGKLHGTVSIPWNIQATTYQLFSVEVRDYSHNWMVYERNPKAGNYYSKPLPETLKSVQLVVTSVEEDHIAPAPVGVTLSAPALTVPGEVEVIVDAVDNASGAVSGMVEFFCDEHHEFVQVEVQRYYWDLNHEGPIPYEDGKLHGKMFVDQYRTGGTYRVSYISLSDNAGNSCGYSRNMTEETATRKPLAAELQSVQLIVLKSKAEGWVSVGDKWYFFANGRLKTGWFGNGGKWYYMNEYGVMQTGWLKRGNTWYYLQSSGAMATGTVTINGKQHEFSDSGVWRGEVTRSGWVSEGGKWYYYKNGSKATGWLELGGKWYFMNESGVMQTGWLRRGNSWFYLKSSGVMATGWVQVGNEWYFMNESGAMQTGWLKRGNTWYYLSSSGAMHTGWLKLGNSWYYMKESGAMVTGTHVINGVTYQFNSSGVWMP